MSTGVALRDSDTLQAPPISALSGETLDLIKKTVASGASTEELRLFLFDCQRQGVHPLDKLVHFSKRGGKYTPITSIDFMRMRAAETGELAGNDDPVFRFRDDDDVIPMSASVTVHRLDKAGVPRPYTATARWVEYYPGKQQGFMWDKMPHLMLGKCAEALALRKAFPKQLHGLYERAEMAQAGKEDDSTTPQPVERTRNHDNNRKPAALPEPVAASDRVPDGAVPVDEAASLLLMPDEDRVYLIAEIKKLAKNIPAGDKAEAAATYGIAATLEATDTAALSDLLKWMQARVKK